jgi:hypothetical protein
VVDAVRPQSASKGGGFGLLGFFRRNEDTFTNQPGKIDNTGNTDNIDSAIFFSSG